MAGAPGPAVEQESSVWHLWFFLFPQYAAGSNYRLKQYTDQAILQASDQVFDCETLCPGNGAVTNGITHDDARRIAKGPLLQFTVRSYP